MKVLILSCSTGGGHNAAASAISEELGARGIENIFDDTLRFARMPTTKPFIEYSYDKMVTRYPWMWKTIFDISDKTPTQYVPSAGYIITATFADRLGRFVQEQGIDTAVCTHVFGAQLLTHLITHGVKMRTYGVMTDYTCLPYWEECKLDYLVIPHADTAQDFTDRGIPAEKLVPLGLPVAAKYRENHISQEVARRILHLPQTGNVYLILTGSMGFGDITSLPARLLAGNASGHVVIVSGKSKKLRRELTEMYATDHRVTVVGFTNRTPLYLDACDMVFSKPGGLASTEIASRGKPLVHTPAIPGFEIRNGYFFRDHGMSVLTESCEEAAAAGLALVNDKDRCAAMVAAQHANVDAYAAVRICDLIVRGR